MTNPNEELVLDADGIPILTDLVHKDVTPESTDQPLEPHQDDVSVDELAGLLLNSETFRQQLDEIAAELTRTVCQQLELTLRPTLEEAISLALDDGSRASHEAVRKHLETVLPDLLARTLQN
ncbi:MAG: hypothetical protein ABFS24_00105 [Pseudomonadota bacterium]